VRELAALIMSAGEQVRSSFEAVCARHGLTPQQARTLLGLKEKAPMRSLAAHLRCDASNITGIADRLEARDLVRREEPPGDRRMKLLALTPRGERVRVELERAVVSESPVMSKLSAEERADLASLLTKMVSSDAAEPAAD
jgi:DNA-binding MarR family transcriptional regulator